MTIFTKLYTKNKESAFKEIIKSYKEKWFLIVNYLYFANIISNWIIWSKKVNKEFLDAITFGDFLLPDWIALNLYYKKYFGLNLPNLNWTDFSNFLLQNLKPGTYNLILYWSRKDVIKKASKNIESKFNLKVSYFQDWYSEFNFSKLDEIISDFYIPSVSSKTQSIKDWDSNSFSLFQENNKSLQGQKINIFMVWLWTPRQEIWVKNNIENIKKYKLLTFTQGWTFDFWAWNEKRAPNIFIKLKLEWLWRFITNPKKNFKKVWYSFYLFYYLFKKK